MTKKAFLPLIISLVIVVLFAIFAWRVSSPFNSSSDQAKYAFQSVNHPSQLKEIYGQVEDDYSSFPDADSLIVQLLTLPISFFENNYYPRFRHSAYPLYEINSSMLDSSLSDALVGPSVLNNSGVAIRGESSVPPTTAEVAKDFSTTNLQVENVDEADIIKANGDFIYSLSHDQVMITNATDPSQLQLTSSLNLPYSATPEDLLLYKNLLIAIGSKNRQTAVAIFDLTNPQQPQTISSYLLEQSYYTSRLIDGQLYLFATGYLSGHLPDQSALTYTENYQPFTLDLAQLKYQPDRLTTKLTTIAVTNLTDLQQPQTTFEMYLMDISQAYVSENSIYLSNSNYSCSWSDSTAEDEFATALKSIWGWRGILGYFDYQDNSLSSSSRCERETEIFKFSLNHGQLQFIAFNQESGSAINQFSFDEHQDYLRVAMNNENHSDGAKVVIFDSQLNRVGSLENIAPGEDMYSSRFIGDKVYLVTYQTIDPLFIIDLSNPTQPRILGELKIPGYSTYLHPYDENHLLGIGMQTEETINRDPDTGRVLSTPAVVTGMKMALFDVSNVNQPREIAQTTIGNRQTTSAVLINHKALLFSKEKNLLAIPVNRYSQDFSLSSVNLSDNESLERSYRSSLSKPIAEGYLVYDLSLENGFVEKGLITHEANDLSSFYQPNSMLRGLYIDQDLFTVSQEEIQVHTLSDLEQIGHLEFHPSSTSVLDEVKNLQPIDRIIE